MPPMNRITVERTALIERVTIIASNDASKYAQELAAYNAEQKLVKAAIKRRAKVIEREFWHAVNTIDVATDARIYGGDDVRIAFEFQIPRSLSDGCSGEIRKPKDPRPEHERALRILELSVDPTIQIAVNGDFARYL